MKNVKIIGCVAAALGMVALTGCKKPMGDEVELTVWVSEADQAFAKEVARRFQEVNADKNYRFVFDVQGENEMATRVLNDVESAADVFSFPNDQLTQLVNGDALTRIGGARLETLKAQNTAASVAAGTVMRGESEEVYGLPYTDNTFFLYYDKSVFTESDVASLDGILAKCSSKKKLGFMVADGWYNSAFYFGKGLGYEVTYDSSLGETSITCNFNNAVGQKVTESLWNLVKDSRVKADADDSKLVAGFSDGSIVAGFSGVWNRNAIQQALGENFAAAKLPTYTFDGEQTQLVAFAGYKLMGVNNYSDNKAEALAFADYYTNAESQIRHFETRSYLPTNIDARKNEQIQNDAVAKAIAAQLEYSKTQKNVPSTFWNPLKGLGNAMLTGVQTGDFSLKAQLDACVAAIVK